MLLSVSALLGLYLRSGLLCQCIQVYFPLFLLGFSVAGFVLRSLIHLNCVLCMVNRYGSIFILLNVDIPLCQHHLLNMLSFFHLTFFFFCLKSGIVMPLEVLLLYRIVLAILGILLFHMKLSTIQWDCCEFLSI